MKTLLTKTIFGQLYLDADPDGRVNVSQAELADPFAAILDTAHNPTPPSGPGKPPSDGSGGPKTLATPTHSTEGDNLPQRETAALSVQLTNRAYGSNKPCLVGVIRRYSNRSDLVEQLLRVAVILSGGGQGDGAGGEVAAECVTRSRRLRDRFSSDDLQAMIGLYSSGTTAKQVAEKFNVSLRSVKRLLHQHGVGREGRRHAPRG